MLGSAHFWLCSAVCRGTEYEYGKVTCCTLLVPLLPAYPATAAGI